MATDRVYDNVTHKFKWVVLIGTRCLLLKTVSTELPAMCIAFMRTIDALIKQGDMKKAEDLNDQYFNAFPQMNFDYDASAFNLSNFILK